MGGREAETDKWLVAVFAVWVVGGTIVDVGLIPRHAVAVEVVPVAIGAVAGLALWLCGRAVYVQLRRSARFTRLRGSGRWTGRPRVVDVLPLFLAYELEYLLSRVLMHHHVHHLGELGYGLVDGIMIPAAIHALRSKAGPPDTSLPA